LSNNKSENLHLLHSETTSAATYEHVTETITAELLPGNGDRHHCVILASLYDPRSQSVSEIKTLIDTGADGCFITSETLHNCFGHVELSQPGEPTLIADLSNMLVLGRVKLPIAIGSSEYMVQFNVVDTLNYPIILGWDDFIKPNDGIIDATASTLTLRVSKHRSLADNIAYLEEATILSPYSETVVTVKMRGTGREKTLYVKPFEQLLERMGVAVQPGIHNNVLFEKEWLTELVIVNLTKNRIELPPLTIVALTESTIVKENCDRRDTNESCDSYRQARTKSADSKHYELRNWFPKKAKTQQLLVLKNAKLCQIINDKLNEEQIRQIDKLVNEEYADLFSNSKRPTQVVNVEHEIDTMNAKPINCAPYRASPSEREIIKSQVETMLRDGIIRKSKSPWASGVVLVKKKDGSVRFCCDYRALNKLTKKDVYPLPRIDDSLAALLTGVFFSTMDMEGAYYQIPMEESSKEKTAFITEDGLYEYEVMSFGLTNAPATFQRYMDATCAGLKWQCLLVYLDDIVVFSNSFDQHLQSVTSRKIK
jgi:hypothetical protein